MWVAVALAFREMLVESVPIGENDQGVDAIVTADEVVQCSQRAAASF